MAWKFDGSTGYLNYATAVVTAEPFTMTAWIRTLNDTATNTIIGIGDTGVANGHRYALVLEGGVAGDPIQATSKDTSSGTSTSSTTNPLTRWIHAGGVFESTTSRTAYADGVAGTTNTTSVTPTGLDITRIGARPSGTIANYFNGRIAHPAVWNVALTAREMSYLAMGLSPLYVRPGNLLFYNPLNDPGSLVFNRGYKNAGIVFSPVGTVTSVETSEDWRMPTRRFDWEDEAFNTVAAATGHPTQRRWQNVPHIGGSKRFAQVGGW